MVQTYWYIETSKPIDFYKNKGKYMTYYEQISSKSWKFITESVDGVWADTDKMHSKIWFYCWHIYKFKTVK